MAFTLRINTRSIISLYGKKNGVADNSDNIETYLTVEKLNIRIFH